MRIRILASASQDLIEGHRFYENQATDLGDRFLNSVLKKHLDDFLKIGTKFIQRLSLAVRATKAGNMAHIKAQTPHKNRA